MPMAIGNDISCITLLSSSRLSNVLSTNVSTLSIASLLPPPLRRLLLPLTLTLTASSLIPAPTPASSSLPVAAFLLSGCACWLMRPHVCRKACMRSTLAALTPPSILRLSVPVRYTSGRSALANSSVLRYRMYDATPLPLDSDGGGTMDTIVGWLGDSDRGWTSGRGVRVLA